MPLAKVRHTLLLAGVSLAALAGASEAQERALLDVAREGETTRVRIVLPESAGGNLSATAEIAAGAVLVARLSEPITTDLSELPSSAPGTIAMARLDPDGQTLRLALNGEFEPRVSVSYNVIAIDLAPPGAEPLADVVSPYERARQAEAAARAAQQAALAQGQASLGPLPATVQVGEASEYTRIAFQWPEAVTYSLEQAQGRAVLRFSRQAEIDLSNLRGDPPRFVDMVSVLEGDGLSLAFALAGSVQARVWSDETGRVVLDIAPEGGGTAGTLEALAAYANERAQTASAPPAEEVDQVDDETPVEVEERPDPVPESGEVPVQVRSAGQDLVLSFPWASLPGAAVFRRADSIWIVFDASAELLDAEIAASGSRHVSGYRSFSGDDYTALILETSPATQADVRAAGASWTVTLADAIDTPPRPVRIARETGFDRPALLRFGLNGARAMRAVNDPIIGDTLFIITADGEKRGVISPRRFAEVELLASAQGVALRPFVDDLTLEIEPGGARLSRPGGLALSRAADPSVGGGFDRPVTAGFLDFARWRGDELFTQTRARLERAALELEPEALLALARFNLAWSLAPETLSLTELAVQERPALDTTPEVAILRGAASFMMGRTEEAEAFLSHPELEDDPAAQPWRGLVAAEQGRWPEARRRFEAGRESVFFFEPVWRSRARAWHGLSALETNDIGAVQRLVDQVRADSDDPHARAIASFAEAGLLAASGDVESAIAQYEALGTDAWTPIQSRALLAKLQLELDNGLIEPDDAVETLDSLRFRWRGDNVEVKAAAMLGRAYAEAGRYNDALSTLEAARSRFPDGVESRALALDMELLFRELFLNDGASRMDPLDALALFYDHQQLTPPGPDGLRMARRIAARLIDIDLLEPAGELLSHQVFEENITMTNLARAEIAADLAAVRLMDDRPEDALRALERTRVARLPEALVRERRLLQARALSDLGRSEHALELVSNDQGAEVERLRAEIAWEARNWADAGRRAEALLGDRWRNGAPLTLRESHDVLRAAIAYALSGEVAGLERVEARYGRAMAATNHAAAFSQVVDRSAAPGDARLSALVSDLGAFEDSDALMAGFREVIEPEGGET